MLRINKVWKVLVVTLVHLSAWRAAMADDEQVITRLARFGEVRAANGTTAEVMLALDQPVKLEGIRVIFLDGVRAGRDTSIRADTDIGFGLFEGGVRFQNYPLRRAWRDSQIVTFPLWAGLGFDATDRTIDAIELKVRLSINQDAWIRPYPETGGVRVHFIRGNDPLDDSQSGNNQRRFLPAVAAKNIDGAGETDWTEYLFVDFGLDPVEGHGLNYVFNGGLGISNSEPSATTIAEFMIDDGSTLPLDDSFIPSRGEPRPGELNSFNFRLLDRGQRLALDGKKVVGWRWKIVKTGPGDFTAHSSGGPVLLGFFYDFGRIERFRRGDTDGSGIVDISDPIFNLTFQFVGGIDELPCEDAADVDDSGVIDISDPIFNLTFQFVGGIDPPPAPGMENCGVDPTEDEVNCESFESCLADG